MSQFCVRSFQGTPIECSPDRMSVMQKFGYWMEYHFSWNHNPCEKYYKTVLVDPVWEISPLMV